jgi:hypothetical protein
LQRTVYFCDRFRRYKFDGDAGGLALLQAMCTKNDVNLGKTSSCRQAPAFLQHVLLSWLPLPGSSFTVVCRSQR